MTRRMLSGLGAIAALAMLANVPAHAEQFKRQKAAQSAQPTQGSQLSGNQHNSADIGVYMGAYAYQIARKCLDNILPECPKKK